MTKLTVYEKKTCVTCKKALAYLDQNNVDYDKHPIETSPPPKSVLESLIDPNNVKASLNTRSAIYKQKGLGDNLPDKKTAITLMLEDANLIKRPVIVKGKNALQGFNEDQLKAFLK